MAYNLGCHFIYKKKIYNGSIILRVKTMNITFPLDMKDNIQNFLETIEGACMFYNI